MKAHPLTTDSIDPDGPDIRRRERDRIGAFLEQRVGSGASSLEIAAVVVAALRDVDDALKPIVGERGVAALYKRTLHLSRPAHPWLPIAPEAPGMATELSALATVLAHQTAVDAAAAGRDLLQAFFGLLNSLIGPSLTERLLCPVWATMLSGQSARGTRS